LRLEVALPLGAVGLYVYDSLLLLFDNEYLFSRSWGHWRATAGSSFVLFGRRVTLQNPFLPHRPVFRIVVGDADFADDGTVDAQRPDTDAFLRALRPFQVITLVQLTVLFLVLPVSLVIFGPDWISLSVVVSFYVLTLVSLCLAVVRRGCLGLDRKALVSLWSDGLLCAPFAVNIVRKMSLHWKIGLSPVRFAQRRFDATAFRAFADLLGSRLAAEGAAEPEDSARKTQIAHRQMWLGALKK
jgi:hypothetical protein